MGCSSPISELSSFRFALIRLHVSVSHTCRQTKSCIALHMCDFRLHMDTFSNALKTWFGSNPTVSLRNLADAAELTPIDVGRVRAGEKPITFKALTKLLPAIEKLSTRAQARALLVAYLNDETPPDFSGDVRVYAIDETTGTVEKDIIATTRDRWETRARSDASFATWWLTTDGYMHEADTDAVDERAMKYQQERNSDLALVAEDPPTSPMEEQLAEDLAAQFVEAEEQKNPPATPPPRPHTRA